MKLSADEGEKRLLGFEERYAKNLVSSTVPAE